MMKAVITIALSCASMRAQVALQQPSIAVQSANTSANASPNTVVQWNRNLLSILRTPGAQPATIHPTRSFAIMHAAIYDAVNAIDRTHHPYLIHLPAIAPKASQDAAAASAAHEVLATLYPKFETTLDAELEQSLTHVADGPEKARGIALGQEIADQILALRSNDGSNVQPTPFVFGTAPGDYQSTPPNFPKPQFTEWSHVIPFALQQASQFRPGPPPALTSPSYTDSFNEVKSLGIRRSTTASIDQALTGRFWNGPIQNYWNEITQTGAVANRLTTAQSARLFALVNLTLADGVIAFYDAKYVYTFWRPVTAIRAAASDNNPDTAADPNWLPEVGNTTSDPSYPGAHAVIASAAATVLASFFGTDEFNFNVTSEVLAGVERSFATFSSAAQEATLSRIYAGVHFRTDLVAGQQLGTDVATYVVGTLLTPAGP
jgi:membrane-associated phospholipid phosphatase